MSKCNQPCRSAVLGASKRNSLRGARAADSMLQPFTPALIQACPITQPARARAATLCLDTHALWPLCAIAPTSQQAAHAPACTGSTESTTPWPTRCCGGWESYRHWTHLRTQASPPCECGVGAWVGATYYAACSRLISLRLGSPAECLGSRCTLDSALGEETHSVWDSSAPYTVRWVRGHTGCPGTRMLGRSSKDSGHVCACVWEHVRWRPCLCVRACACWPTGPAAPVHGAVGEQGTHAMYNGVPYDVKW